MLAKVNEDWVCIVSVHFDLVKNWELHFVSLLNKELDIHSAAWFLLHELVAWEGEDVQAFFAEN